MVVENLEDDLTVSQSSTITVTRATVMVFSIAFNMSSSCWMPQTFATDLKPLREGKELDYWARVIGGKLLVGLNSTERLCEGLLSKVWGDQDDYDDCLGDLSESLLVL